MGTGGEPGPLGNFLCLKAGGSIGSTGIACILEIDGDGIRE
jgi:hypothetical protein